MSKTFLASWLFGIGLTLVTLLPILGHTQWNNCATYSQMVGNLSDGDDMSFYMPRVTSFAKGFFGVGDPVFYEHRYDYFNNNDKIPTIIAGTIQYFTKNAYLTFVITRLIFLPISVALLYGLLHRLTRNSALSILAVIYIILAPELFSALHIPLNNVFVQFHYTLGRYIRRFTNNLITFPMLILYIHLLLTLFQEKYKVLKRAVLAGLLIGIFSFSYFYYWSFSIVAYILVAITSFLLHRHEFYIKNSFRGLIVAFIFSLPFVVISLYESIMLHKLPGFNSQYELQSMGEFNLNWYDGNTRSIIRILIFCVGLLFIHFLRQKRGKSSFGEASIVLAVLYLSTEIIFNSNIILGFALQPDHYMYAIGWLFVNIFIILIINYSGKLILKKYFNITCYLALLLVLIISVLSLPRWYHKNTYACDTSQNGLLSFLNKLSENSVVQSSPRADVTIQILNSTNHFVFFAWTNFSTAPFDELLSRRAYLDKLFSTYSEGHNLATSFAYSFMYNKNKLPPNIFSSLSNKQFTSSEWITVIPDEIYQKYQELYSSVDTTRPPYKLDYIIASVSEEPLPLTVVFRNDKYVVYAMEN